MHTFSIVSPLPEKRQIKREELLKQFKIDSFSQIILDETQSTISSVRNVQKRLILSQRKNQFQALIIKNLNRFSLPAQQALLKTLEEPPKNTIIIIEAENQDQILPTLISRSWIININSFLELTTEEKKQITLFWTKILKGDLTHRLNQSSELTTNLPKREDFLDWIDRQLVFFRQLMIERTSLPQKKGLSVPQLNQIIKLLLFSKKSCLFNVNLKLLSDYLFINVCQI